MVLAVTNAALSYQDLIYQKQRGFKAQIHGQFNSVYRLGPSSNVSVLNQAPLYNVFPIEYERTTSRKLIENAVFELLVFEAFCNGYALEIGDICVDNATGERYCFAQRRAQQPTMFCRVEILATIGQTYNPGSARPRTARGPGGTFVPNYGTSRQDVTVPLTLVNGSYAIGALGDTPATIPVGIQLKNNLGGPHDADLTNTLLKANYMLYVPPLGADLIRENMVVTTLGAQFIVLSCRTNIEGFAGTVAIVQKVDA